MHKLKSCIGKKDKWSQVSEFWPIEVVPKKQRNETQRRQQQKSYVKIVAPIQMDSSDCLNFLHAKEGSSLSPVSLLKKQESVQSQQLDYCARRDGMAGV